MSYNNFYSNMKLELKELEKNSNLRQLKNHKSSYDYKIDFSSNDYLNLNFNTKFKKDFFNSINFEEVDFGSTGSRLLGGNYPDIVGFEQDINKVFKRESLVLGSGYDANTLVLETFYTKGDIVFTDRYNHASIYDGLIHSGVKIVRYKHLDYSDLENKLKKYRNKYNNSLIITESIYSMDGDIVDLKKIIKLKNQHSSQLFLDEAHSYGVMGYGQCYNEKAIEEVDFIMLGLGKGGASNGAILILKEIAKSYIINKGRKFIYTTSPSPFQTAWNRYVFNNIDKLNDSINSLNFIKNIFYRKLKEKNIETTSTEQIISIVIGDNSKTIDIANKLQDKGYIVYPIKEPTVPRGTSRLRFTLHAGISIESIGIFVDFLDNLLKSK